MRILCLLLLAMGSLFAQIEPGQIQEVDIATFNDRHDFSAYEFTYEVVVDNGVKTLLWNVQFCSYPPGIGFIPSDQGGGRCQEYSESIGAMYSAVRAVLAAFYGQYPDGNDKYGPISPSLTAAAVHPRLTTVAPVAPPNPQMVFLDGLGDSLLAVDMTTFATVSQVVVPSTSGPLGIRSSTTSPSNEVWVANGGIGVSVVDLGAQSILANILTPSVPQPSVPVSIVFDAAGAKAFEAISYYSPDSSGNNGALLVFDAVNRVVTSTLPLKYAPSALTVAPDGSTLYMLDNRGTLTYYDVLSGTADLSVSTFTPGQFGGTNGGPIFIHPDGTRLFWNINYMVYVWDLTTRKITAQFNSGLPTTSGVSMTMSQDGGRVYLCNGQGDIVIMDTQYGNILATTSTPGASTLMFGGPPTAP